MMKVYKVGGSVRDALMGMVPHDHDYVVVGSTPEEMEAQGFSQVGKDFPVYLHPETNDEYALARIERKAGLKHTDFETKFDSTVTIVDDLRRRDLTINAIAVPHNFEGEMVDPYGGLKDIENKVLRHVSEAFAEDPLRILRVARFNARFPDFKINIMTKIMIDNMVLDGALDHISKDRIWAETKKALLTKKPVKYFEVLAFSGALKYVTNMEEGKYIYSEPFNRVVEATESFSDERKILVRAAEFYGSHWLSVLSNYKADKKLFIKTLRDAKLPVDIIELATFVGEHSDFFVSQVWTNSTASLVSDFDRLNIRIMVQKNPNFFEDLFLILDAWEVNTKDNLEKIRHMMEAFLDTKEFLSCEMKRLEWAEARKPNSEEIKEMIADIKFKNVAAAQSKFWNGIQFNLYTMAFEEVPLGKR
jgi:tRNA nucleotidyltransferase/poly(A) polymerase